MEVVVAFGAIRRAKLQSNSRSNSHCQQTNTQLLQSGCPFCRPTNSVWALKENVICIWSVFDWLVNCSWWLCCWKRNRSILCTSPSNTNSRTSSLVTLSLSSLRCRFLPVRMLIYRFQFFLTSRLRFGIEVLCRSCICHKKFFRRLSFVTIIFHFFPRFLCRKGSYISSITICWCLLMCNWQVVIASSVNSHRITVKHC